MTADIIKKRSNKVLRVFALFYNAITLFFILNIKNDPSITIEYVFIFPIFWIIGGIILGLLFWLAKIKIKIKKDWALLFISTPLPVLAFLFILPFIFDTPTSSFEFNRNGHRHREDKYQYSIGHPKRIEYYISKDIVTEENPFPKNDVWLKDSTWTYFNKHGEIVKVVKY